MHPDTSSQPPGTGARRRPLRLAAFVAAAYLVLEPTAGAAAWPVGDGGAALRRPVAVAMAPTSDRDCVTAPPPARAVSRAAARGTLPDTGGGSQNTFIAAAGLLVGGLLLRTAAGRLRRRDAR